MLENETVKERYKRWWEGKYCKCNPDSKFKYVQTVEFIGPPSGFYGVVILHYLNGTEEYVTSPFNVFKPRKSDVIVGDDIEVLNEK